MVELQEAKRQISEAKQNISQTRSQIQQTRQQYQQAEKGIRVPKKRPKFTPRKVREEQRLFLTKEKPRVESELNKYEKDTLIPYEQEVSKYEKQVSDYERALNEYNERQAIIKVLQKARAKGTLWMHSAYGEGLERSIARQMLRDENAIKQMQFDKINEIQASLPSSEKLVVDYKNMKITGVESGTLQQSFNLDSYNKKIQDLNKSSTIPEMFNSSIKTDPLTGLKTSVLPKELPKIDTKWDKIKRTYNKADDFVQQKITDPLIFNPLSKIGVTKESISEGVKGAIKSPVVLVDSLFSGNLSKSSEIYKVKEPVSEFAGGVVSGIYEDVRENPLKQVALYGGGRLLGFGVEGFNVGVQSIPKIGKYAGIGLKSAETLGGLALSTKFGIDLYGNIKSQETAEQKGAVFGTAIKDITLIGSGFGKGQKDFTKTYQYLRTLGRQEVPQDLLIPESVLSGKKRFVENPTGKIDKQEYLNLFETQSQRTVRKLKSDYSGEIESFLTPQQVQQLPVNAPSMLYHQAPTIFWNKNLKVTQPGTSEFEGLYGAYAPSPHFLKTGSQSSYKLFPSWKELFAPSGKPGSAAIIPDEFILAKSGKPGQAFVSVIKPEVEAILPIGTEASLIDKSLFYKWNNVRIPLDVFRTVSPTIKTSSKVSKVTDVFSSYLSSSSSKSSVYNPQAGFVLSIFDEQPTQTKQSSSYKSSSSNFLSYVYQPSKMSKPSRPSSSSKPSSSSISDYLYSPAGYKYKSPSSYKPSYKKSSKLKPSYVRYPSTSDPFSNIYPGSVSRKRQLVSHSRKRKSKRKGRDFVLFETGYQATLGEKKPRRYKKLSSITGFELLR